MQSSQYTPSLPFRQAPVPPTSCTTAPWGESAPITPTPTGAVLGKPWGESNAPSPATGWSAPPMSRTVVIIEEPLEIHSKVLPVSISAKENESDDLEKQSDIELMEAEEGDNSQMDTTEAAGPSEGERNLGDGELAGAFSTMAVDGFITVEQLPALLALANVTESQEEVNGALQRALGHNPESDEKLQRDDVLAIVRRLRLDRDGRSTEEIVDERLNCLGRWADGMSDSRATNVLLIIVVVVAVFSAYLAAGLAILFMWNTSFATINNELLEDLGTVKDVVDVFQESVYQDEVNSRILSLVTVVANVVDLVSYRSTLDYNLRNLQYLALSMAEAVGGWWAFVPEQGYTNMARVSALWLSTAIASEGRTAAFEMVNVMQPLLPPGYELLLGRWATAANTSFDYLTTLRYSDQCANGTCSVTATGDVAMMDALMGMDGALLTMDYRLQPVLVGYASTDGVGVEYKSDLAVDRATKAAAMQAFFDEKNLNAADSHQFILGTLGADGLPLVLTTVTNCDLACMAYLTRPDGPLGQALQQNQGTMTVLGTGGVEVMTAYAPVPGTALGLVVQMNKQDCLNVIVAAATTLVNWINDNFSVGTEELELTALTTVNGTATFTHLSALKFAAECPGGVCTTTTPYLEAAKQNCSSGVMRTTDYRGVKVVAGYYCIADMNVFISMKMDDSEMQSQLLSAAVEYINNRNTQDTGSTDEFFLAIPKAGVTNVTSSTQVDVLTTLKNAAQCVNPNCTWNSPMLVRALENLPGDLPATMTGLNYAGVPVTGAIDYDATVGVAMSMDMDTTTFMATIIATAAYVLYFTTAAAVLATVFLIVMTKQMMRTMINASDEGKRAVERERQQFGALVASMYPAYVVPRLLAGDTHIVSHIKHTAVFFSDIYEFTSASNTIAPEELVQFMQYTYGVMDDIAGRYGVYKVKTVGDAYLAVAGLPAADDRSAVGEEPEKEEPCLTLLRFAACVAQVFSHCFAHPDKGSILKVVAGSMSWNRRRRRLQVGAKAASKAGTKPGKSSVVPSSGRGPNGGRAWTETESSLPAASEGTRDDQSKFTGKGGDAKPAAAATVQCAMSYGIACGPIIAGVLQGRSPMFDIWGPTVNLASRMESTGQPGRIQVSEGVARKVSAVPGQPFHFEPGHKTYCKGFGAVSSYFVRSTVEPPPRDLLGNLGLKPALGMFYFDNLITGPKRVTDLRPFAPGTSSRGGGSTVHSQGKEDTHSQHSKDTDSQTSGARNADPTL